MTPDKFFDWAIVDPPYGGAGGEFLRADGSRFGGRFDRYKYDAGGGYINRTGGTWAAKFGKKIIAWDNAPREEYFNELFRVSKQQIVWGGNYFGLPPNRCFLVWHKTNIPENFSMAMAEYAWCSMNENAKLYSYTSARSKDEAHWHPTEKPVALYAWILRTFAHPGDKILDTHLGSGSSRIAAYDAQCPFVGFEVDPEYFAKQEERFAAYTAQLSFLQHEITGGSLTHGK